MRLLLAFTSGMIFAIGLAVSGMTNPANVIGFLDLSNWKPALILVMVGAISVHTLSYWIILHKRSHIWEKQYFLPSKIHLDKRLITGSMMFGIGWGLAGYCPGPALTSAFTLNQGTMTFIAAMLAGLLFFHFVFKPIFLKEG